VSDTDVTTPQTDENAPVSDSGPEVGNESTEESEAAQEHTEPESDQSGTESGKAQAKLRKRAQAAEQERDQLASRVEALQRQIVDDAVERTGVPSKAFWAANELGSLLDDGGNVNTAAVTEAAEQVRREFSIARLPQPNRAQGSSASGPPEESAQDAWKNAFKRR